MMTAELDPRTLRRLTDMHALYRMFDHAGRLLYVGVTGDLARRLGSHMDKRWFPLVTTITLEWFPTRAAAALAEHRAIQSERPRLNVAGKNGRAYQPPGSQCLPQTAAAARDAAARDAAEKLAPLPPRITLREAVEDAGLWPSLAAARKASTRPGFPEPLPETRGGAFLYDLGELKVRTGR